jgi:hypothetical protein
MTELPQETLDWFEGDELRARVFFEKYALQDIDGMPLRVHARRDVGAHR